GRRSSDGSERQFPAVGGAYPIPFFGENSGEQGERFRLVIHDQDGSLASGYIESGALPFAHGTVPASTYYYSLTRTLPLSRLTVAASGWDTSRASNIAVYAYPRALRSKTEPRAAFSCETRSIAEEMRGPSRATSASRNSARSFSGSAANSSDLT